MDPEDDLSTREALEAAYDEADKDPEESVGTPAAGAEESGGEEEGGEITAAAEEQPGDGEGEAEATGDGERPGGADESPTETPPAATSTAPAPASWTPTAKEAWNKLPAEVQQEVAKREHEISTTLTQTAEARKGYEEFRKIVDPFANLMSMEGATPYQAVDNLVKTAAHLRLGTQAEKAQIVSNIINQYGIDVQVLDQVLSGQQVPDPQAQMRNMIQQQMQPITQQLQGYQQREQQQHQQQGQLAQTEVEAFGAGKDFFNDVRNDMADLLDLAVKNNRSVTLEEAYEQACMMNPEIRKIMAQRKEAEQAGLTQQNLQSKRNASSTIQGSPTGGDSDAVPATLRGAIEAAVNQQ